MMARRSRIAILVASIALGLMYVLPVWTIDLEAPQYPEGLGMVIRINTIEGQKPHDLDNINNLNHYIGMRRIVPESIPELKMMPFIVGALMLLGGLVALMGRKRLLYLWVALFIGISTVGLVDFWKWEYDYGHNLDEEVAIIKIPGMSYQPPLIGSKQILNFTAHSWPGVGGLAAMFACLTGVIVARKEWRDGRRRTPFRPDSLDGDQPKDPTAKRTSEGAGRGAPAVAATLLLGLTALGCGDVAPRPLIAGSDDCETCLMTLDASGHGSEFVTQTGKVHTFDSVECMANYLLTGLDGSVVHSVWVTDFSNPDQLVDAEDAFFLKSQTLTSPMGLGLTAFARAQDRDGALHAFGGEALGWDAVQQLVSEAWPDGRPTMRHGGHSSSIMPGS